MSETTEGPGSKPIEVPDVPSLSRRVARTHLGKPQQNNDEVSQAQLNTSSSVSPSLNPSPSPNLIRIAANEQSSQVLQSTTSIAPSPSLYQPISDPNNNKDALDASTSRSISLLGLRRSNFSKSASGGRLVTKSNPRPACGCLAQNCSEMEHPNRQQFIEHYYYSRTRLPTADAMSSFNINTPLSSLNECDAITKRLLSSPIRTTNFNDRSVSRTTQDKEVDVSTRRASLGTSTMTDQVFLFSSNQYESLESNEYHNSQGDINTGEDNQPICDSLLGNSNLKGENVCKLKQQQGRSLSVCHDDTLKPRYRKINSNHSSNLSRTVSLACESGAAKRSLTIIPLFGCDIEDLSKFMKLGLILPPPIDSAVDHILTNGVEAVGIFRKSGVKSRILNLRQRIEGNQCVKMEEINMGNEFSIYDIADLVKMWFRELKPTPLMTKELIALILKFSPGTEHHKSKLVEHNDSSHVDMLRESEGRSCTDNQVARELKHKIIRALKPAHRALFSKALSLLTSIASRSGMNQMTSQNLAICLTPSLCATETDQVSIVLAQKALEYCIDNYRILF